MLSQRVGGGPVNEVPGDVAVRKLEWIAVPIILVALIWPGVPLLGWAFLNAPAPVVPFPAWWLLVPAALAGSVLFAVAWSKRSTRLARALAVASAVLLFAVLAFSAYVGFSVTRIVAL